MRRYTRPCNPSVVRLPILLQEPVSSYLTFSPLPFEKGGYFLLLNSAFTNSYPLDSRVLCVVRTFLFYNQIKVTDRFATRCKINIKFPITNKWIKMICRIYRGKLRNNFRNGVKIHEVIRKPNFYLIQPNKTTSVANSQPNYLIFYCLLIKFNVI